MSMPTPDVVRVEPGLAKEAQALVPVNPQPGSVPKPSAQALPWQLLLFVGLVLYSLVQPARLVAFGEFEDPEPLPPDEPDAGALEGRVVKVVERGPSRARRAGRRRKAKAEPRKRRAV